MADTYEKRDRSDKGYEQEFWRNGDGELHRLDGPAFLERDLETGVLTLEQYWVNGQLHRVGGPAVIERDEITKVNTWEEYYVNHKHYNDQGPVIVSRSPAGKELRRTYMVNGTYQEG